MDLVTALVVALKTTGLLLGKFLSKPMTHGLKEQFDRLLVKCSPMVIGVLRQRYPDQEFKLTKRRVSYSNLLKYMNLVEPRTIFPDSAAKTLGQTLKGHDQDGALPGGLLGEEYLSTIITALAKDIDLSSLDQVEFDSGRLENVRRMLNWHNSSTKDQGELGTGCRYRFYHENQVESTVQRLMERSSVAVKLSECQRLLAVHFVTLAQPLDTLAEYHRLNLLARLGPATLSPAALSALGEDRGGRFGWVLAKLNSSEISPIVFKPTPVRAWLPFPPGMDPVLEWQRAIAVTFDPTELLGISTLLNDTHGSTSCPLQLSFDEANLLAEILISQSCAATTGPWAAVLASSILTQTGLPWLPPAATTIDWSRPDRVLRVMCAAVGLVLPDNKDSPGS
jgi:hypothetical protein